MDATVKGMVQVSARTNGFRFIQAQSPRSFLVGFKEGFDSFDVQAAATLTNIEGEREVHVFEFYNPDGSPQTSSNS